MADVRLLELRVTYKWGGGPDKTILLSAERHDPSRVSVVVAYIRDHHDTEFQISQKAKARGLTFYEIVERGKFDLRVLRAIRDIVIRHDINVIHGHDYKSDVFAYLIRKWLWYRPMALVSTAHGWALMGTRGALYRYLDLFLMRRFDYLIAVSEATKNQMLEAGISESKISMIYNSIDTETWAPDQVHKNFREEWGWQDAFPIVGYVGRITEEKDLTAWLNAAALIVKTYPKARFVLVGDGKDSTLLYELQRLVESLHIRDQVQFLGYRSDLLEMYATFDIFLLSSRTEGLSNSILEAMALGLPIVATAVGGTTEIIIDQQTGILVPSGDIAGMANAVLRLAGDEQLRRRLGQVSRERVEQEFSFHKRLLRVEELYEHILGLEPHTCSSSMAAVEY